METIYMHFDQYIKEYRRMEAEIRTKAVVYNTETNEEAAFCEERIKTEPQKISVDETWNERDIATNWFSYSRSRCRSKERNSRSRSKERNSRSRSKRKKQ